MKTRKIFSAALLCCVLTPIAHATSILNTGVPDGTHTLLALDGNDFYAVEFNVAQNYKIDSIAGYLQAGGSGVAGDTFTISLYQNSSNNKPSSSALYSAQATYTVDGWNGVSGLQGWNIGAGNYWVAFEVGGTDSASVLLLPTRAQHPLATAFSDGSYLGYQLAADMDFGVQVEATSVSSVPLPGAAWLFVSGIGAVASIARRRK